MVSKSYNVVIAEDNFLLRKGIEELLKNIGHNILGTAPDGEQAIELVKNTNPDIVLMDIDMPKLNGIEATKTIMEECPVPVIILSAYDFDYLVEDASKVGISAYLSKPTNENELKRAIEIAMARFNDIKQSKKLAKSLQKSNLELEKALEAKNKFVRIIGHDLKAPLSGALSLSGLLMERFNTLDDNKRLKIIRLIHESNLKNIELLNNLLTWSRLEANAIQPTFEKIPLHEIIKESILINTELAINKPVTIVNKALIERNILSDKNMTNAAFRNIISNAIKYSHPNGNIYIELKDKNEKIETTIRDEGIGMSQEKLNDLFKIEKYESSEGTKGEKGTGLGLIMVKEFIENCHGEISIQSQPNFGTIVTISYPKIKDI
jgi:signal transduction histidine kinase